MPGCNSYLLYAIAQAYMLTFGVSKQLNII